MNKLDLAAKLAKETHRSRAKAADAVDTLVHDILVQLKQHPQEPTPKAAPGPAPKHAQSPAKVTKKKS